MYGHDDQHNRHTRGYQTLSYQKTKTKPGKGKNLYSHRDRSETGRSTCDLYTIRSRDDCII